MPLASWKGFLRLSLVSCPGYLSPATTRTNAVRLHQVWVPRANSRGEEPAHFEEEEDQIRNHSHKPAGRRLAQSFANRLRPIAPR
jgi:hypothetical protein